MEELLQALTSSIPAPQRVRVLRDLVAEKTASAASTDARFWSGLAALRDDLRTASHSERLFALAAAERFLSVAASREAEELAASLLLVPFPDRERPSDVDDRVYVARAMRRCPEEWAARYLALAAIEEETGEKARKAAVSSLLDHPAGLASGVEKLVSALRSWKPETASPGESAAKRMKRLVSALAEALLAGEREVEVDLARLLADLVRAGLKGTPEEIKHELAAEVGEEVAALVHGLIRAHFSLAAEASMYEPSRALRSWFTKSGWRRFVETSAGARTLRRDLIEALGIVAKQGAGDDALFASLTLLSGGEEEARKHTASLAERLSGVTPEVQAWLRTGGAGGTPGRDHAAAETDAAAVARLLREVQRLRISCDSARGEIVPELEVVSPRTGKQVVALLSRASAVMESASDLADRARVRLRGAPGEIEEYNPLEHDLVEGSKRGARIVRVILPVAFYERKDGVRLVVSKGLVEPTSTEGG